MHPVEIALLILAVAWITNLYNFMDGSDGLAGGMATIGFGAYALRRTLAGDAALARDCAPRLRPRAAAFLVYNLPSGAHLPRRRRLDSARLPCRSARLAGWRNDLWPLWFPVLVFGPFIGDATLTLVRRLVRGERVWQAHREPLLPAHGADGPRPPPYRVGRLYRDG